MGKPRMIILVRHAQSEGNQNREIHQVIPDHRVKLTEDGWRQAEDAGRRLRHMLRPDDTLQIFTSPYRRTRETTEGILRTLTSHNDPGDPESSPSPFSRSKITVYEEPRLREQDFGNFQPSSAEMERMWRERADYGHFFYRIPNGESAADAYDRVSGFNESLWRQFGDDDFPSVLVLVTHGLMTRVFLMKWYHWSVEYFEDLRNINHCEFILMSRSQTSGKYLLENKLRTWSELRRQKAEEEALQDPVRRNTLSAFLSSSPNHPESSIRKWGHSVTGHKHETAPSVSLPRQQAQREPPKFAESPLASADAANARKKTESDDHPLAPHETAANIDGTKERAGGASNTAFAAAPAMVQSALPGHILPERSGRSSDALTTSGMVTPHEMSEDEAEYFNPRQPRSMARAMQQQEQQRPQRRATPEDVARWADESGMGKGKQADALGDEPEKSQNKTKDDSAAVPRTAGEGKGPLVGSASGAVEGVGETAQEEEEEERSVRQSVY